MFTPGIDIWMHSGAGTGGTVALLRRFTASTGADNQGRPVTSFQSTAFSDAYEFWRCISGLPGVSDWASLSKTTDYFAGVMFATPVQVSAVQLRGRVNAVPVQGQGTETETPVRWRIEGSNDTTTGSDGRWQILTDKSQADTPLTWSRGVQTFAVESPRQYRAVRIWIVLATGPNPGLSAFQLLGRQT